MRCAAVVLLLSLAACKGKANERSSSRKTPTEQRPSTCDPAKGATLCAADMVVTCNADGTVGSLVEECKGRCRAGACVDTCAIKGNELIYLVDSGHNFLSFDPEKLGGDPFHMVGKLECETAGQPFSMGVANDGIAWVLYNTGRVYRVSIIDAHCAKAGDPDDGPETFGMGFASVGATAEKLFVAANDDSQQLMQLDTAAAPLVLRPIAKITAGQKRNPELTGTADGALFGYFPEDGSGGFVQELDTTTGAARGPRMPLGIEVGEIEAYAFAHWGGVFYIFITAEHTSSVHAIHRKTGKHEVVRERIPYEIVGAGVSTCAPELERAP